MTWVVNKAGTNAGPPVDPPYSKINRFVATAAALATTTPLYPGEPVLALDTGDTFQATDITTGHWQKQAVKQ